MSPSSRYVSVSTKWRRNNNPDIDRILAGVPQGVPFYERTPINGYEAGWEDYPWAYLLPAGSTYVPPAGFQVIKSNSYSAGDSINKNFICPEYWTGQHEVRSGRNIHLFGGGVEHPPGSADNGAQPGYTSGWVGGGAGNESLRINGRYTGGLGPRTSTWEGYHIKGEWCWEGLNFYSQQDREINQKWTFLNYKIDQINVLRPTSGGHLGGDGIQNGAGFSKIGLIGADWRNMYYQGWFYQPLGDGSFGTLPAENLQEWTLRHVSIQGAGPHAQLLWDTQRDNPAANDNINGGLQRIFDDIHVQATAGQPTNIQNQRLRPSELAKQILNQGAPARLLLPSELMGPNYIHMPR